MEDEEREVDVRRERKDTEEKLCGKDESSRVQQWLTSVMKKTKGQQGWELVRSVEHKLLSDWSVVCCCRCAVLEGRRRGWI